MNISISSSSGFIMSRLPIFILFVSSLVVGCSSLSLQPKEVSSVSIYPCRDEPSHLFDQTPYEHDETEENDHKMREVESTSGFGARVTNETSKHDIGDEWNGNQPSYHEGSDWKKGILPDSASTTDSLNSEYEIEKEIDKWEENQPSSLSELLENNANEEDEFLATILDNAEDLDKVELPQLEY